KSWEGSASSRLLADVHYFIEWVDSQSSTDFYQMERALKNGEIHTLTSSVWTVIRNQRRSSCPWYHSYLNVNGVGEKIFMKKLA
ncbi:9659_t:CDS:2, partial [Funneliformis mosseae]